MSRTLDDLRSTLAAHGRELPTSSPRTVAVHRRIRRIRRQRVAGAAVAVPILLAGATLVVNSARSQLDRPASHGLAQYYGGGQLAASMRINSKQALSSTVDVVAPSSTLILRNTDCSTSKSSDISVEFLLNGASAGTGCGVSLTTTVSRESGCTSSTDSPTSTAGELSPSHPLRPSGCRSSEPSAASTSACHGPTTFFRRGRSISSRSPRHTAT